jgi:diguanylate cyclase (GGDEF)-like protein
MTLRRELSLDRGRSLLTSRSAAQSIRVLCLVLALTALGLMSLHLAPMESTPGSSAVHLSWWALAPLFAVAEMYVLHLQVRSEAQTVSLSEIPLALGLFFASPATLVVGRLVGAVCVFVIYRRQPPLKVAYNAALTFADTAVALVVYRLVLGSASVLDLRSWLAMYVALAVAGILDEVATTLVISFYEDRVRLRDVPVQVLPAAVVSAAVGTVAMTAAYALSADRRSAWALLACAVLLFFGYRAYGSLRERHLSLERLYGLSQEVGSSTEIDGVLHSVLNQASELLRAQRAEITFLPDGPDTDGLTLQLGRDGLAGQHHRVERRMLAAVVGDVVDSGAPALLPRRVRDPALRRHLVDSSLREAVVVPLLGESGVLGALTVADRMGQIRTFDASDVRLLETIANHASVALTKRRLVDQLRYDAMHDALTGLPNRTALRGELQRALAGVSAGGTSRLAVIIMDLDGFKEINDTLGHHHGDLLLQQVASRMLAAAPGTASVARLGGDEFAIVLRDLTEPEQGEHQVRGIIASLEDPCMLDGIPVVVRASVGIAIAPDHGVDVAGLLRRADIAMYAAKAHGRGFQLYESALRATVPNRLALSGELRSAIERDELVVHVQPQASLATGEVLGVEALVRWHHPKQGLLYPDDFIALAERSGLIKPLTLVVLDKSLAANAAWRAAGISLPVSVNLSARSLSDPDLVGEVAELLDRHRVPATGLTLEITETSVVEVGRSVEILQQFADMGVRISIDDFGTGESSLAYLRRLPVSEIKIDKSFVIGMTDHSDNAAIVRAIVDLGTSLHLGVVAEGVEELAVWDRLADFDATCAQGSYLSWPMPTEDFLGWLHKYDLRRQRQLAGRDRGAA